MARKKKNKFSEMLERFSQKATQATGTSSAFLIAAIGDCRLGRYRTVIQVL